MHLHTGDHCPTHSHVLYTHWHTSSALCTSCRAAGSRKLPWTLADFSIFSDLFLSFSPGRADSLLSGPHRGWINPLATALYSSTNRTRFLRNTTQRMLQTDMIWKNKDWKLGSKAEYFCLYFSSSWKKKPWPKTWTTKCLLLLGYIVIWERHWNPTVTLLLLCSRADWSIFMNINCLFP